MICLNGLLQNGLPANPQHPSTILDHAFITPQELVPPRKVTCVTSFLVNDEKLRGIPGWRMEMKSISITLDAHVLYMMRLTIQEVKGLVFCMVQQGV